MSIESELDEEYILSQVLSTYKQIIDEYDNLIPLEVINYDFKITDYFKEDYDDISLDITKELGFDCNLNELVEQVKTKTIEEVANWIFINTRNL